MNQILDDAKKLRFRYINHRNEDREYTIEPAVLKFKAGHWMITGFCLERDGKSRRQMARNFPIRSFAVIEMRAVEEVD